MCNFSTKGGPEVSNTLYWKGRKYLNGQHLACKVWIGMGEILTKSGLSLMYKMIREIILIPREDSGYLHNFMVNSWVFKNNASESDAKTNSRHRVCLLLVGSPLLAWRVNAQSPLLTHCVNTHTHARARNFFTKSELEFFYTLYWKGRTINILRVSTYHVK